MKLYILPCGWGIQKAPHYLAIRRGNEKSIFMMPIPAFLIEHPNGPVMIDAGMRYESLVTKSFWPDYIGHNLQGLGYSYSDIKHLVISHGHIDHVGFLERFRNAKIHIRQDEYEIMFRYLDEHEDEDIFEGYQFSDYVNCRGFDYNLIPPDSDYDLFGDGSIVTIDTMGHSAGHQSVIVNLPKTGRVVLTGDAAQLSEDLEKDDFLKNFNFSGDGCLRAQKKLQTLRDEGCLMILGHEPDLWWTYNITPGFYD